MESRSSSRGSSPAPTEPGVLDRLADCVLPRIGANCWFCNTDQRIRYSERRWWRCGHCDQFNGFSEDGDYRYRVPGMSETPTTVDRYEYKCPITELNRHPVICTRCDVNNHMRVLQLARLDLSGGPNEENYWRLRQLERGSKLCSNCETAVRDYIERQDFRISRFNQRGTKKIGESSNHSITSNNHHHHHTNQSTTNKCELSAFFGVLRPKKTLSHLTNDSQEPSCPTCPTFRSIILNFLYLFRILFSILLLAQSIDEYIGFNSLADLVDRYNLSVVTVIISIVFTTLNGFRPNDLGLTLTAALSAALEHPITFDYVTYWQRIIPSLILSYVAVVKSFKGIHN